MYYYSHTHTNIHTYMHIHTYMSASSPCHSLSLSLPLPPPPTHTLSLSKYIYIHTQTHIYIHTHTYAYKHIHVCTTSRPPSLSTVTATIERSAPQSKCASSRRSSVRVTARASIRFCVIYHVMRTYTHRHASSLRAHGARKKKQLKTDLSLYGFMVGIYA
jgi:hypothetical protein